MINYELILGDCLEEMQKMKDGEVDVVFTSPPYNDSGKTERDKEKRDISSMNKLRMSRTGSNGNASVLTKC